LLIGFSKAREISVLFRQVGKDGTLIGKELKIEKHIEPEKEKSIDPTALITEEDLAAMNEESIVLKVG